MYPLPRWPGRFVILGTLALAGVLLASGCGSASVPEPVGEPPSPEETLSEISPEEAFSRAMAAAREAGDCEPGFTAATERALAAVRLVYFGVETAQEEIGRADFPQVLAFYIGDDEWVSTAWLDHHEITLAQPDPTATRRKPDWETARPATLIGRDARTGLALLRADGTGVPPLRVAAGAPQVGDRLRAVGYSQSYGPHPAGSVLWPGHCAPTLSAAPLLRPPARPSAPRSAVNGDGLRFPDYLSPWVVQSTVQEFLTVDAQHYLNHQEVPGGVGFGLLRGAPLFTPDGTVVGAIGTGIWRAEVTADADWPGSPFFDLTEPTLATILARLRVGDPTPPVVRPTLHAFCYVPAGDAAVAAAARHPSSCQAQARAGVQPSEAGGRWVFWLSGPDVNSSFPVRIRDAAGRELGTARVPGSSGDPQLPQQLSQLFVSLPPGLYAIAVLGDFGPVLGNDDTQIDDLAALGYRMYADPEDFAAAGIDYDMVDGDQQPWSNPVSFRVVP